MTSNDDGLEPPAQPAAGPAEEGPGRDDTDGAVTSLRRLFAERRLSIASMDRPLRLATAAAAATLLATVLLLALRDIGGGHVYLGAAEGSVTQISLPIFVAVLVLTSVGFGYLLTAISATAWWVAYPFSGILLFLIGTYTGAFGQLIGGLNFFEVLPNWARWTGRGILVGLAVLTVGAERLQRRRRGTRIALIVGFATLVGGYLIVIWVGSPTIGGLNLYGPIVDLILGSLVFLMYPVLQVAAVDFGEWGELSALRLTTAATRGKSGLLWPAGVAATLAMAAYGYSQVAGPHGWLAGATLAAAGRALLVLGIGLALLAGVMFALRWRRRSWPRQLHFASIVAVCGLFAIAFPAAAAALTGSFSGTRPEQVSAAGRFLPGADVVSVHGSSGPTGYSVQLPRGWISHHAGALLIASDYDGKGGYARVSLDLLPGGDLALLERAFHVRPIATETAGVWHGIAFRHAGVSGLLWAAPVTNPRGAGLYVLYETVHGSTFTLGNTRPTFVAIARSFRGSGQPPAPLPPPAKDAGIATSTANHQLALEVGLGLIAGAAAVAAGLALARRRWRPQLVGAGLLFGAVSLFTVLFFANDLGHYLFGGGTHLPYLSEAGTLLAAGIFGLVGVLAVRLTGQHTGVRGRRLLTGIVGLEGAIAVLQLMFWLYGRALSASRISIWAAVILLVAVGWDVTMSGESLTNRETPHLPRESRVLGFFGYIIVLAGTVLFYSAEKVIATGGAAESFFEPESITQAALFRVALPVLLLAFFFRQASGPHPAAIDEGPSTPPDVPQAAALPGPQAEQAVTVPTPRSDAAAPEPAQRRSASSRATQPAARRTAEKKQTAPAKTTARRAPQGSR